MATPMTRTNSASMRSSRTTAAKVPTRRGAPISLWHHVGITNYFKLRKNDTRFLLFADFDNVTLTELTDRLKVLERRYFLGPRFIISTGAKNFWVVYFSALPKKVWLHAMKRIDSCDGFKNCSKFREYSTLRLTDRHASSTTAGLVDVSFGKSKYPLSSAHIEFFCRLLKCRKHRRFSEYKQVEPVSLCFVSYFVKVKKDV